jgi:hypothetical protein
MMIMLCQWDFSEQTEKLVDFYSVPPRILQENSRPGYILYSVNEGLRIFAILHGAEPNMDCPR